MCNVSRRGIEKALSLSFERDFIERVGKIKIQGENGGNETFPPI